MKLIRFENQVRDFYMGYSEYITVKQYFIIICGLKFQYWSKHY